MLADPHSTEEPVAVADQFSNVPDSELVSRIIEGDGEALLHLVVKRCGSRIRIASASFRYQGDLFQDVMVHLFGEGDWARLKTWEGKSSLEAWMSRVILRVCLDDRRKTAKQPKQFPRQPNDEDVETADDEERSALFELLRKETWARVLAAIEKLPERDKLIIYMLYFDDSPLSNKEAALRLGMEDVAFRVARMRAITKLIDNLGEVEGRDHE